MIRYGMRMLNDAGGPAEAAGGTPNR
jgi:hypothetical protein